MVILMTTTTLTNPTTETPTSTSPVKLDPHKIRKAMATRSFATLASSSSIGHPHVAGVLYELVGTDLWINTMRNSRKARNIEANERVGVTIPVRRLPVGPPSTIQFQGTAEVFTAQSPEVIDLVGAGLLKSITSHGELELDGSCFVRLTPKRRLHTYGLGLSLLKLIRDPLNASGSIELADLPS
jgi:hypothetical protein